MTALRSLASLALATMLGIVPLGVRADAGPDFPRLVEIRAAHHPGFDRVVFAFEGGLPERTTVRWVDRVTHDPSGLPVEAFGNAYLRVALSFVEAHQPSPPYSGTYGPRSRAFDLPNVAHVVNAGDFEAVVSFGIGVMKRTRILRTARLRDPGRFVIDLSTKFTRSEVDVFLADSVAYQAGDPPYVRDVSRTVPASGRGASALMRLFAGPTAEEKATGLRFVASGATGFADLRIGDTGIARVRLTGGCDGHGRELTVASEIMPTLRALPRVDWVKIHSPAGRTQRPWGPSDSIPACLEP